MSYNKALTFKSRKCFKCQGYMHIASKCSNQNVVALVEEEDAKSVVEFNDV